MVQRLFSCRAPKLTGVQIAVTGRPHACSLCKRLSVESFLLAIKTADGYARK